MTGRIGRKPSAPMSYSRATCCRALKNATPGARSPWTRGGEITSSRQLIEQRLGVLVQPGDQRRQELAQHRRPFSMLGAAGGVAEIAVELEIARLDPGRGQGLDDIGRDLWWKKRVGAAQDVKHLGLDPGEVWPGVKAEQRAAQDDQRVGVPFGGPVRGL